VAGGRGGAAYVGVMGVTIAPAARRPSTTAVGVAVWLASEVMFFAGLFGAYFALRAADAPWPPADVHLDTLRSGIFTVFLVLSSLTLHRAESVRDEGDEQLARVWTLLTLGLGTLFLANQALEWTTLDFHVSSNAYGTIYYVMTGFHGLHVAAGLALLALAALLPSGAPATVPGLHRATVWYWHFVDVVWVAMFSTIFLIR